MHEQSETVSSGSGKKAKNVYGKRTPLAGITLPPEFHFEKYEYGSLQEAEAAAKERSRRHPETEFRSKLPKGLTLSPKGDLSHHRSRECKQVFPDAPGQSVSAHQYFKPFRPK